MGKRKLSSPSIASTTGNHRRENTPIKEFRYCATEDKAKAYSVRQFLSLVERHSPKVEEET